MYANMVGFFCKGVIYGHLTARLGYAKRLCLILKLDSLDLIGSKIVDFFGVISSLLDRLFAATINVAPDSR